MAKTAQYVSRIQSLLDHADIQINGSRAFDIQVHDDTLYPKVIGKGSLGLGEAFMAGDWSCQQLDELFCRLLQADLANKIRSWRDRLFFLSEHVLNRQSYGGSKKVAYYHYNIGNDLYAKMLDQQMIYSCGYWRDATNLDQAQRHKLDLIAKKLRLQPGMKVLDIGCGWGGSANYLNLNYGVDVVGVSIAEEQIGYAKEHYQQQGVDFTLCDYRELNARFDAIYSIGMFEHVGFKNYKRFFEIIANNLSSQGLFLLHTIGHPKTSRKVDPWMARYIFPNSILPSRELVEKHSASYFTICDWHQFEHNDYYRTLQAWQKNCEAAWSELGHYDARFQRMWRYYLGCCAGAFKANRNFLWQILFSKQASIANLEKIRSAV